MTLEAHAARLTLRGHDPVPAVLEVEHRSARTRATRAALALLGFSALAPVVFLLPPHIPWAFGAAAAGLYFGYRQWAGEYLVRRFEGVCPRCSAPLELKAGSLIKLPHAMSCYSCHHEPVLVG